jgi:nucleotidyltransferase substrate binding protein (TIGR01987 family)
LEITENPDTLLKIDCIRFDKLDKNDIFRENILKFKKVLYVKGESSVEEIFWKDYFNSLGQAITRLAEVIRHKDLDKNDFMQDAAVQRFEFVIELFWKVLKKILVYEKSEGTTPRDVLSKSYQFKLIDDEEVWLKMLDDRNRTSNVYKEEEARRVFENIKNYLPVLEKTYAALGRKYSL